MAHTFESSKVRIHHDGDFSGDVTIVMKNAISDVIGGTHHVVVPFEDLHTFVMEKYRQGLIEIIEGLDLSRLSDCEVLHELLHVKSA
jgi:hypothetical protein